MRLAFTLMKKSDIVLQLFKWLKLWFESTFINVVKISEKDIPSRFLDEERYAKEASGSGAQVRIPFDCAVQLNYSRNSPFLVSLKFEL